MYPFNVLVNGEVIDSFRAHRFSLGVTIWEDYCKQYGATEDVGIKGNTTPYTRKNPITGVTVHLKVVLGKHEA